MIIDIAGNIEELQSIRKRGQVHSYPKAFRKRESEIQSVE
jgi:hypothetical protein